jgi:hypothetical protein
MVEFLLPFHFGAIRKSCQGFRKGQTLFCLHPVAFARVLGLASSMSSAEKLGGECEASFLHWIGAVACDPGLGVESPGF